MVSDAELKAMTIITPIAPAYIIGIAQKPEEVPSEQ